MNFLMFEVLMILVIQATNIKEKAIITDASC